MFCGGNLLFSRVASAFEFARWFARALLCSVCVLFFRFFVFVFSLLMCCCSDCSCFVCVLFVFVGIVLMSVLSVFVY